MKRMYVLFLVVLAVSLHAEIKSVEGCHALLKSGTVGPAEMSELTAYVKKRYGKTDLSKNQHRVLIEKTNDGGGYVLWALRAKPKATVIIHRVISFVGSYCDFRPLGDYPSRSAGKSEYGPFKTAHDYPALICKTNPPKKIRIFLQDGRNDLDNTLGNWFANNRRMAAALAFSGYAHKVAWGDGMHSKRHGMAILPEIMEWIWQD